MSPLDESRPGIETDTEATTDQSEARPKPARTHHTRSAGGSALFLVWDKGVDADVVAEVG